MTASTPDGIGPAVETQLDDLTLQVVEERLGVGKRRVASGLVRVSTTTEVVEEVAEIGLDRYRVEVTRVPVGRIVEAVPLARSEGDVTIVPVVEERFVVVKQLVLTEEVHIRHIVERDLVRETVPLRRQHAVVEHREVNGNRSTVDRAEDR